MRRKEEKAKDTCLAKKKMIWDAVLECLARALRMLGFTRKPVKVLFLGLDNAGKTTLMYAMKHGPRGTYDVAHDPTFGLSAHFSFRTFLFFFFFVSFFSFFWARHFSLFFCNFIPPFPQRRKKKQTKKNRYRRY